MGHAPHVLDPWLKLEDTFFKHSLLPSELLEQVRRTLAQQHGCQYCQAKAGPPDPAQKDPKTSMAVDFAELFAVDHKSVTESHIAQMRQHFSDSELVELIAFVGFMWAGGTFGALLGVKPREAYESQT